MSGGGGFLPSVDLVSTVQKIYSMILFIEKCLSLPTGHSAGSKGTCAKAKFQGAKGFPKVWQIMEHVFLNMIPFSRDGHVDQNVPPINAFKLNLSDLFPSERNKHRERIGIFQDMNHLPTIPLGITTLVSVPPSL